MEYVMPEDWNDRRQALITKRHTTNDMTPEEWLEYSFLDRVAGGIVDYIGEQEKRRIELLTPRPMCQIEPGSVHGELDYQKKYRETWKVIVELSDGTINPDQVARELFDYSNLIHDASDVYCHVSGNRISKPNTKAFEVKNAHDDEVERAVQEAIEEFIEDHGLCGGCEGLGEIRDPDKITSTGPRIMMTCNVCKGTGKRK